MMKKLIALGIVALCLGLFSYGCGGAPQPASSPSASPAAPADEAPAAEAAPADGAPAAEAAPAE